MDQSSAGQRTMPAWGARKRRKGGGAVGAHGGWGGLHDGPYIYQG